VYPDYLLTKGNKSFSYAELARLKELADSGDAAAAVRFSQLPESEKRLAAGIVKVYGGKPAKKAKKAKKPAKPKVTKSAKRAADDRMLRLQLLLGHPDPWVRETARKELLG